MKTHEEQCREIVDDMLDVVCLVQAVQIGSKTAAEKLNKLAAHVSYRGRVVTWNLDAIIMAVLEPEETTNEGSDTVG